jgi:DNA polymerase-3 subunit delta'
LSFKNIKGQDRAVRLLKNAAAGGKAAHAYIFLGPSGVGKRLAALNFARALNCGSLSAGDSCDVCASCRKITTLNHPDVSVCRPDNSDGSIGIDAIRRLIKSVAFKPYEGKVKVGVIDGADRLTAEASNALLKTLEEPPADSVLILITEDISTLYKTIVSRSQIVRFFFLKADTIQSVLVKEHRMDEAKARILSHLASGSLAAALKFQDDDFCGKRSDLINNLIRKTFFESDYDKVTRSDLKLYLGLMLTWFRDILLKKIGMEDSFFVNIDRKDAVAAEAAKFDTGYLMNVIDEIVLTNSYLGQNVNPKIAMGLLGLNISRGGACTR